MPAPKDEEEQVDAPGLLHSAPLTYHGAILFHCDCLQDALLQLRPHPDRRSLQLHL